MEFNLDQRGRCSSVGAARRQLKLPATSDASPLETGYCPVRAPDRDARNFIEKWD